MSADACTSPNRYVPSGHRNRRPQDIEIVVAQGAVNHPQGIANWKRAWERERYPRHGRLGRRGDPRLSRRSHADQQSSSGCYCGHEEA